jgi:amino acid adenylation domain-containing protein
MFKSFIHYFLTSVACVPSKQAIVDNDKSLTYQELNEQSDNVASYLLERGVKPEEIIPLIFDRCADMVVAMIGILKSGCAFLPISSFTPCVRKKFLLEDSKARFVLTQKDDLKNPSNLPIQIISIAKMAKSKNHYLAVLSKNQLAYVMYTSGSTGIPKGVLIEHNSLLNLFLSLISELSFTENTRVLALTDYTFDISLIELLMPLMQGATIVLTQQGTVADGLKIKNYLTDHDINFMQATPISWEILLKQGWRNNGKIQILVGGEKFSTRLAESLEYQRGNVWNMYGPTETSMWSLSYPLKEKISTDSVPLGEPLANTTTYILDHDLNEVEIGREGELYIGGQGLARGYLNNVLLTQQKFIYHPKTFERLYKTGDRVVRYAENNLCYIGRTDDQLKFGGIRVEAGEIESIIEQETFVKKAVVKVQEQEGYYKFLTAYVEIDEEIAFKDDLVVKEENIANYFRNIYNEKYLHAKCYENQEINVCGWQSSFTGELFSVAELKESYHFIEKVIHEADLSNVLEIGAGTGVLLSKFIEKAEQYTVVEISDQAIDYMKSKLCQKHQRKVNFKHGTVLDIHEQQWYSCVIINSVIQYFPSIHYLRMALEQLVNATQKNGTIVIGDIRSLELLEVFLLQKHIYNKNSTHTFDSFYYKLRESEIVVSPQFFLALTKEIPAISHVDISVKHGVHKNELNYFRYDAILHINKTVQYRTPIVIDYEENIGDERLNELTKNKDRPVIIKHIPNVFVIETMNEFQKVFPDFLRNFSVSYPKNGVKALKNSTIDSVLNYKLDTHEKFIIYGSQDPLQDLEMHLCPKIDDGKLRYILDMNYLDLRCTSREPFNAWVQKFYFDRIKAHVNRSLISWITPSVYIWVEKWPVTINGKLDKKRLTLPVEIETNHDLSNTLINLKSIWRGISGDHLEVDKDFSAQGISSLYVHFLLATINEKFGINISYRELCRHDTPRKLAKYMDVLLAPY